MNKLIKVSFGSTAAIVTSMGLIVGLSSIDSTKASLLTGLLIIAIADNVSDTFGIHIFQESRAEVKPVKNVIIPNFLARLIISLSFIFFVVLLPSQLYQYVAVIWGMFILSILSFFIAQMKKTSPIKEITFHVLLAFMVIAVSQALAYFIKISIR
ncbi:MAG: hypothetical protein WCI63_02890 [bacterium]